MDREPWAIVGGAFDAAAAFFAETAAQADVVWERPGLGEWTVLDLVGHTSRALGTVETYLAKGADHVELHSPVEYFAAVRSSLGDPAAVAQRGRDAGAALGGRPADAVQDLTGRVRRTVAAADGDELVGTPAGGMVLAAYLPTRTFELTVHTCDIAEALGLVVEVPAAAASATMGLAGALAARSGTAGLLLRASTGRHGLPPGYTVL